jgi:hypothetical protein
MVKKASLAKVIEQVMELGGMMQMAGGRLTVVV